MTCPHCGQTNGPGAAVCDSCHEPLAGPTRQVASAVLTPLPPSAPVPTEANTYLPSAEESPTRAAGSIGAAGQSRPSLQGFRGTQAARVGPLNPGQTFGPRYHIIRVLGAGGMGAVYQAWDEELGVAVAIKVVLPEIAADPERGADVERRFKRELLLARQVTHKNVVRIHDLGEIDGIKYITMPYVHGQDLAAVLREHGKLPVSRALAIARQIAAGLQAAHEVGVVHRDLKPPNIMLEGDHVLIMDFGIARSAATDGATIAGAVIGTLEYMAPEQAKGDVADQRADVYAFGLILYDMLLGRRQSAGTDSAVAELMRRIQSAPPSPRSIDPSIPDPLDRLIARCLDPDPSLRFATSAELCAALDAIDADGTLRPGASQTLPPLTSASLLRTFRMFGRGRVGIATATAASVILLGSAIWVRRRPPVDAAATTATATQPVSLAILPLRNASADPSLDWLGASLAEMLRTEVGQSSHLRAVSSDRLHQILRDLHIRADAQLDPAAIGRLAEFASADTILSGQYVKLGNEIRIDATLQDIKHQRATPLKTVATDDAALFGAIANLAGSIRQNLALSPDIVRELKEKAFTPSTRSLEALRQYDEGLQLARQGKHAEALKKFQASTDADPSFALAYAKLGQSYANGGYDNEAEQFSRKAVELSGGLPPQEKYVILADHARVLNDNAKAIESYENLAKVSPQDPQVHFSLASLYETVGSLDLARDHYAKVLAADPNYVDALFAYGRVEIKRGNPQGSLDHLNRAENLAVQLDNDEARANVLNAIGVAYKRLQKPDEAVRRYQQSLEIKRRIGDKRGIAITLGELAQINESLGRTDVAEKSYKEALQLQRDIGDKKGLGTTLINLGGFYNERGRFDDALRLLKDALQIEREVGNETMQSLCLNNIGNVYLAKGEYEDALLYFERSLDLREKAKVPADIADTRHNLAETAANLGRYDQALADYLRALDIRRNSGDVRGAAIESYSMGTVFGYQGRYGAALKSKEDALTAFRSLQDRSFWFAEVLGGYGSSLAQVGRTDAAGKALSDAMTVAQEIKNPALVAQTLNFQGDAAWYSGDVKTAAALFRRALEEASKTTDRRLVLVSKMNVAKTGLKEQGAAARSFDTLKGLAQQADATGLKFLSVECSIDLAAALIDRGDPARARLELQRALSTSERLGLRGLQARVHYLLAVALRKTGSQAESARELAEARRLADDLQKEAGTADVLKRADFRPIYEPEVKNAAR